MQRDDPLCILHVCSLSPPPLHTLASAIAPRGAAGADIAYVTVLVIGLIAVLGSAAACGGASFEGRHGSHSVRLLSLWAFSSFDHRAGSTLAGTKQRGPINQPT